MSGSGSRLLSHNPEPEITVVTPCLNPGERLARCLDSVASQSYRRIEHLVIDGGSTDGTVELLTKRGVPFVSERDRGQTHALNKGFALASGDWIGWLNADDVLTPDAIEVAVAALKKCPRAGWTYGDCDGRMGDTIWPLMRPPHSLAAEALEYGNVVPQPGALVARWALARVGPLDEDLQLVMDFALWLRLLDAGIEPTYVPHVLAVFEISESSKTGSIPFSEFHFEEALVLARSGRMRPASLMVGHAAAEAARTSDGIIGTEVVEIRRLDQVEIPGSAPIYLKLDVQGAELEVLAGATRTLERVAAVEAEVSLVFLYESQPLLQDVTEFMRDNGFALVDLEKEFFNRRTQELLAMNATFVRVGR